MLNALAAPHFVLNANQGCSLVQALAFLLVHQDIQAHQTLMGPVLNALQPAQPVLDQQQIALLVLIKLISLKIPVCLIAHQAITIL